VPQALKGQKAFVLCPAANTPGRKDASGAFGPEAQKFVQFHGLDCRVRAFDNTKAPVDRWADVSKAITVLDGAGVDVWAFFCHGTKRSLQCSSEPEQLGSLIAKASGPAPVVVLYACDAGRDADAEQADDTQPGPGGDGGFAARLHMALNKTGARVFAHTTTGHTTQNPNVRVWESGNVHGKWVVVPDGDHWRAWKRLLRTAFRWQFPFLTAAEVDAAVGQSSLR
jgi:hypothetical protein